MHVRMCTNICTPTYITLPLQHTHVYMCVYSTYHWVVPADGRRQKSRPGPSHLCILFHTHYQHRPPGGPHCQQYHQPNEPGHCYNSQLQIQSRRHNITYSVQWDRPIDSHSNHTSKQETKSSVVQSSGTMQLYMYVNVCRAHNHIHDQIHIWRLKACV